MLGAVKRWLGGATDACAGCDPAVLEQCSAAEPGVPPLLPHSCLLGVHLLLQTESNTLFQGRQKAECLQWDSL